MKKYAVLSIIFVLFLNIAAQGQNVICSAHDAIVEIPSGKLAGYIEDGIYVFKGIPYAVSDRFMQSVPVPEWDGLKSCRTYGPICPQVKWWSWRNDEQVFMYDFLPCYEDEDCLRINIWTPAIGDGGKRPVMFYIHGGGYVNGSGHELPQYDGYNMALKGDVVTVTINHRLNILGFLDLSSYGLEYRYSANNGILDIIHALEWVKENIGIFGGNPDNITVYGQSGGGGKITALLSTPYAVGLFHKAIIQSGSIMTFNDQKNSRMAAKYLFGFLGLREGDISGLNEVSYDRLCEAGEKTIKKLRENGIYYNWGPVFDSDFFPEIPFETSAPEMSYDIPVIIGTTLHEFPRSTYLPECKSMTDTEIKNILMNIYGKNTEKFIKNFKEVYPSSKPYDILDVDVSLRAKAVYQADMLSDRNSASVYVYLFKWESPMFDGNLRSCHNMDTPFSMSNVHKCRHMLGVSSEAYVLEDRMSSAWISFARTGNPNCPELPLLWEKYTKEKGATMIFDNRIQVWYNHDRALLDFISGL